MTEHEWLTCEDPDVMLKHIKDKVSDRKLRLFACACCWRVGDSFLDPSSRLAVEVAEAFADGLASKIELNAAREEAELATLHNPINIREAAWHTTGDSAWHAARHAARHAAAVEPRNAARKTQTEILRDIVGKSLNPVPFQPHWKTQTMLQLALAMYDDCDFSAMPILGDALEEAGCIDDNILSHCRNGKHHVRGCWVVDFVLGKK